MRNSMHAIGALVILAALGVVLAFPSRALAEETTKMDLPDRLTLRGGYLYVWGANTTTTVTGEKLGVGATLDFDETLGGQTSYSGFKIDGMFRFNENHSIGASWYRVERHGEKTLTRDVQIGDLTINAGSQTTSELNIDLWRLIYNWSFYRSDKVELGVSPSVYIAQIKFAVNGNLTCTGVSSCTGLPLVAGSTTENITVPLPSIGGFVDYRILPRLSAQARFDFFYLQIGSFRGSMFETYVGLDYRLLRNFSIGAAYDRLAVEAAGSNLAITNSWNTLFLYGALHF